MSRLRGTELEDAIAAAGGGVGEIAVVNIDIEELGPEVGNSFGSWFGRDCGFTEYSWISSGSDGFGREDGGIWRNLTCSLYASGRPSHL